MSRFHPVDRQTGYLLPPSLAEWLPEDHLARFVVEVVDGLNVSALESQDNEQDLNSLFGSHHGLDAYGTKRRYSVQERAFSKPDAYIGIYQTLIS